MIRPSEHEQIPDGHTANPDRPRLTVVTGDVGAGKTTRLERLVRDCRADGLRVGGVIARRTRDGYEFVDVHTGRVRPYATRNDKNGRVSYPRFRFDAEAFVWVRDVLRAAVHHRCDVIVYDEYGPLERDGGGAFEALNEVVARFHGRLAIVVRRALADTVPFALGIAPDGVEVIDVGFLS